MKKFYVTKTGNSCPSMIEIVFLQNLKTVIV